MENDACQKCGNDGIGPWLDYCPLCIEERQPSMKLDDEGFLCALDGTRILDENHPLLAWARKLDWQCFAVSRDGKTGRVRGLRRTCQEWDENANKAWSRTRRRVRGVPRENAYGNTTRDCAEMLRSSLFHVWHTVPQRFENQCETDYYVNLGLIAPGWQTTEYEDIGPGFYVIEADTFEFVQRRIRSIMEHDPKARLVHDFIFGGDLQWFRAAGKDRPDAFNERLVDRDSVSLMALTPRKSDTFFENFDKMIEIL